MKLSGSALSRILGLLVFGSAVIASLIAFPAYLSIMAFFWLATAVVFQYTRHESFARICCGALAAILIAKTPSMSVAYCFVVGCLLITVVMYWTSDTPKMHWGGLVICLLGLVWFSVDRWVESSSSCTWATAVDRPIVCIGDSLTEGIDGGYPAELQKLVSPPVLNLGRNGYTTQMAIDKTLPQLSAIAPQLVIIELGGHDYNTGKSRSGTKRRLRHIIRSIQSLGAAIIIVEIPRGIVQDPFFGLERELAREFDLELVPDNMIRKGFFFSSLAPPGCWLDSQYHLSDDGLHPNATGQIVYAQAVAAAIERLSQ